MKTDLIIHFKQTKFKDFVIKNSSYVPINGEVFNCRWEDFVIDNEQLKLLNEF